MGKVSLGLSLLRFRIMVKIIRVMIRISFLRMTTIIILYIYDDHS